MSSCQYISPYGSKDCLDETVAGTKFCRYHISATKAKIRSKVCCLGFELARFILDNPKCDRYLILDKANVIVDMLKGNG